MQDIYTQLLSAQQLSLKTCYHWSLIITINRWSTAMVPLPIHGTCYQHHSCCHSKSTWTFLSKTWTMSYIHSHRWGMPVGARTAFWSFRVYLLWTQCLLWCLYRAHFWALQNRAHQLEICFTWRTVGNLFVLLCYRLNYSACWREISKIKWDNFMVGPSCFSLLVCLYLYSYFRKMLLIFSAPPFYTTYVHLSTKGDSPPFAIWNNPKFWPFFKDAIGTLNGSHIHSSPSASERASSWNCKGFVSQNCPFACNFFLKFVYALTGWEGSAPDAWIYAKKHIPLWKIQWKLFSEDQFD